RVRVDDPVDFGTGGEHAGVPAVLLRRLEVEAAHLIAGQVHLDHVLDCRVAERHPGGGAQIAIRVGDAHADVAARTRGEPALAGPVADVDQVLLRIEDVHAVVSIGDRPRFSTAHDAWRGIIQSRAGDSGSLFSYYRPGSRYAALQEG